MNRTIISTEMRDNVNKIVNPVHREKEHKKFTFDDYRDFCHKYFPTQSNDIIENDWKAMQYSLKEQ